MIAYLSTVQWCRWAEIERLGIRGFVTETGDCTVDKNADRIFFKPSLDFSDFLAEKQFLLYTTVTRKKNDDILKRTSDSFIHITVYFDHPPHLPSRLV